MKKDDAGHSRLDSARRKSAAPGSIQIMLLSACVVGLGIAAVVLRSNALMHAVAWAGIVLLAPIASLAAWNQRRTALTIRHAVRDLDLEKKQLEQEQSELERRSAHLESRAAKVEEQYQTLVSLVNERSQGGRRVTGSAAAGKDEAERALQRALSELRSREEAQRALAGKIEELEAARGKAEQEIARLMAESHERLARQRETNGRSASDPGGKGRSVDVEEDAAHRRMAEEQAERLLKEAQEQATALLEQAGREAEKITARGEEELESVLREVQQLEESEKTSAKRIVEEAREEARTIIRAAEDEAGRIVSGGMQELDSIRRQVQRLEREEGSARGRSMSSDRKPEHRVADDAPAPEDSGPGARTTHPAEVPVANRPAAGIPDLVLLVDPSDAASAGPIARILGGLRRRRSNGQD